MNLNDYFDPVSLERPDFSHMKAELTISRKIDIHTPDNPISGLSNYDIAIFGIKEDRNAFLKGSANAPDRIREKIYLLANGHNKLRIIDLGNIKTADTVEDIYFALRDVYLELLENSVIAIAIGGSQDLGLGFARSYENFKGYWNFTTVDSRLDFNINAESLHSGNYLNYFLNSEIFPRLSISNIGHQAYFTPLSIIDNFENQGHTSIRLGPLRSNLRIAEPHIRDTHIFSIDLNSVRQSEAPAGSNPSPNGLFAHELCQLTRYAGASSNCKAILFSELLPQKDISGQSAHLFAQAIWYFIDGVSIRTAEDPSGKGIKKFIVSSSAADRNMVFYKSIKTERWWMELPVDDTLTGQNYIISCSYEDYQKACTNEIPDRWWRLMRRYS